MNILITGSSGFIGYHLTKKLLENGNQVYGVDNHNDYYDVELKKYRKACLKNKNFYFFQQDINQMSIKASEIDLAINLAAQPGVRVSAQQEKFYQSSNVDGFKEFCNFCELNNVKKIIYASSSSVYSDKKDQKYNENYSETIPTSLYGSSKLQNEKYASEVSNRSNISFIGLRFFSVYGPMGRPDMAYYLFTENIKNNKPLTLIQNGEMYRDMTYIDDIIAGTLKAIDYINKPANQCKNEIFNLGNDAPIKTFNLLELLEKEIGKKSVIQSVGAKKEHSFTHADITKAKNLLGYEPKVNLEDGIKSFLNWHMQYEHKKNT
tara:strand:+ start:8424 stop:9383 length:960 start_codon:yes stop_codon:yes gene_type:complete